MHKLSHYQLILALVLALPLLAEDAPNGDPVQKLAAKDAEIAQLRQQLDEVTAWYTKTNASLAAAWNSCIGPPPQKSEAAKTPQRPTQNPKETK